MDTRLRDRGFSSRAQTVLRKLCWCVVAAAWSLSFAGSAQDSSVKPAPPSDAPDNKPPSAIPQDNVSIEASEPRYVAPTLRDQIGRIWAPVLINGKGPFRLVLDTGASGSAVTAEVAQALGIPLDESAPIELQGATGSATVPTIRVTNMLVGDLLIPSPVLPIVPDALGGAQGVLGTEALLDKRISIDFRHDRITIKRSGGSRADPGFVTVPMKLFGKNLLTTRAWVGSIRATAIIDTGAATSVANLALRRELQRHRSRYQFADNELQGATDDIAKGQDAAFPPIALGDIVIRGAHITTGDLQIFDLWKLTANPAILIGMDALGTLDDLVIDYRRRELQVRVHQGPFAESIYRAGADSPWSR